MSTVRASISLALLRPSTTETLALHFETMVFDTAQDFTDAAVSISITRPCLAGDEARVRVLATPLSDEGIYRLVATVSRLTVASGDAGPKRQFRYPADALSLARILQEGFDELPGGVPKSVRDTKDFYVRAIGDRDRALEDFLQGLHDEVGGVGAGAADNFFDAGTGVDIPGGVSDDLYWFPVGGSGGYVADDGVVTVAGDDKSVACNADGYYTFAVSVAGRPATGD